MKRRGCFPSLSAFRIALGLEIGVEIRPTERVDRLFGVSDEHEWTVCERRPENPILSRIRILEFVDQGVRPT
jgi:hypothetical protein